MLALAIASFLMAIWILVPAPIVLLLPFAVVVPELAPQFVIAFVLVVVAAAIALRGTARLIATAFGTIAFALACIPLVSLPHAIGASDAAVRAVTGRDAAPGETADAHPFDLARELFGGSERAPSPVLTDRPVVTNDGAHLALDVYRSAKAGPRPTVVLLYGGAWQFGRRSNVGPLARELAALGYTAIAVDYRHAPAYRFPTQRDDVRAALATIARHAGEWGVDTSRVATLGESAGAELALLAAYEPGPLHVRATVAYYAPLDLTEGYALPPDPDPIDVRNLLRTYLGDTPQALPAAYVAASPRAQVRPGLPPTLLIGGVRDELCAIGFQREMRAALVAAGDPVAALEFTWSNHGFAALENGLGNQLARYYTERFLAETMGR